MPITAGLIPVRASMRLGAPVRGYLRKPAMFATVERSYGGFGPRALGRQRQKTWVVISGRGNRYRDAFAGRRHLLSASSSRRLARALRAV